MLSHVFRNHRSNHRSSRTRESCISYREKVNDKIANLLMMLLINVMINSNHIGSSLRLAIVASHRYSSAFPIIIRHGTCVTPDFTGDIG